MLLSEIVGKRVYVGNIPKGKCTGIGVSLKTGVVKYLLCSSTQSTFFSEQIDFCINLSAVQSITEDVNLTRLRPVFPKSCVKLFLGRPIYSDLGAFVGTISDVTLQNNTAKEIFCDNGKSFPFSSIAAVSDAVILKKVPPYPLGQRIPAPFLSDFSLQNDSTVTKTFLRCAMAQGKLIQVTMALPPFYHLHQK